jgi:hypothetical protein
VPYRAPCHGSFDKEQVLIGWALHTATYHYFRGERALEAYKRVVQSVGTYLEHARKTDPAQITSSAVWRDYLHSKATLAQISGRPDVAASLNSQVKTLFPSEPLESLQYEGCTMCCRLETLTGGEDYLLRKIDEQLQSLIAEFQKSLSASSQPQDSDIHTKIFYVAMLRCKAQARRNQPDLAVMKQAIEIAEASGMYISGPEKETYDASVKQGSVVWFLGAYACSFWLAWLIISGSKFVSDQRDSGMVSAKIMSAADWATKIFSGLALALTIAWIKTGIP